MGKWSDKSERIIPEERVHRAFVNTLSIRVAELADILVGLVINGRKPAVRSTSIKVCTNESSSYLKRLTLKSPSKKTRFIYQVWVC